MEDKIPGVPLQNKGGHHDTESKKCFNNIDEAALKYKTLKQRLVDINSWQSYSGKLSASFCLYNSKGEEVKRNPVAGDFIKIDIPGPGNNAGDGFDWVQVAQIDEKSYDADERFMIKCIPSVNPTAKEAADIAHFYSEKASSSFIVSRKNNCITAEIHGRNEVSNTDAENVSDKLRNIIVAIGGRAGLAKIQWKILAEGLLDF